MPRQIVWIATAVFPWSGRSRRPHAFLVGLLTYASGETPHNAGFAFPGFPSD